jgi:hypothetical protein
MAVTLLFCFRKFAFQLVNTGQSGCTNAKMMPRRLQTSEIDEMLASSLKLTGADSGAHPELLFALVHRGHRIHIRYSRRFVCFRASLQWWCSRDRTVRFRALRASPPANQCANVDCAP